MIKNLDDIYDPEGKESTGTVQPAAAPAKSLDEVTASSFPSPVQEGVASNIDVNDYSRYLTNGVYNTRDINLERGQQQSVINKIATRVGNIIPNMAASLLDMAGDVGTLFQFGDNRTYDNAFTKAADAIRNPLGEVYARIDRNSVGSSLSDPGWWIDNIAGAVELVAPFALAGAGVGGVMDRIASGASDLLKLGADGTQVARGIGQLGTSAFMSYTMAAQGGARVFHDTYQAQMQKLVQEGKSPDEADVMAKHIAAQSAATSVQLGTMLGTVLNAFSMAPYFRNAENTATSTLKKLLVPIDGETQEAAVQRVATTGVDTKAIQNALNPSQQWWHKALEAGKMGLEMQQLQFSEKTGAQLGKDGKSEGFFEQFGELENYFDRVGDKDGFLAFATGAAAGLGLHYLQHSVMPSKLIDKVLPDGTPIQKTNADGTPKFGSDNNPVFEKQLVTPKTYDATMTTRRFTNMRDAVVEDYNNFSRMREDYKKALAAGNQVEAAQIQQQMMDVTHLNAVKMGVTEPWLKTFGEIADYDNQTAQDKGFSSGADDNEYKQRAAKAGTDLKDYKKVYDTLQKKYGTLYTSNEGMKDLVDMVFARKVDLMSWDKVLKEHETKLRQQEAEQDDNDRLLDPEKFDQSVTDYNRQWETGKTVYNRIKADHDDLIKAVEKNDTKRILEITRKYRAAGMHEEDIQGAISNLSERMQKVVDQSSNKVKVAQDSLYNSTGYTDWLANNPNGTFHDFVSEVQQRYGRSLQLTQDRADIEESRARHGIAAAELAEIEKPRSLPKFARKAADWISKLRKDTEETERNRNSELISRAKDQGNVDRIARLQIAEMAKRYAGDRDEHLKKANELDSTITTLQKEYDKLSSVRDPLRKAALRRQIKEAKLQQNQHRISAAKADSLREDHTVNTTTPTTAIPVQQLDHQNLDIQNETKEDPLKEDEARPILAPDAPLPEPQVVPHETVPLPEIIPEVVIPTETDPVHEALTEIHTISLHPTVVQRLGNITDELDNGTTSFSLDLLKPEVEKGLITQADAAKALNVLQKITNAQEEQQDREEVLEYTEAEDIGTGPIPHIDGSNISAPDTVQTEAGSDEQLLQTIPIDRFHSGQKISNVLSIANSTIDYTEHYIQDKGRSTGKYIIIPNPEKLNPNLNPDILRADKLMPSTRIHFEVDTEYDGKGNHYDHLAEDEFGTKVQKVDKFSDYVDDKGKITGPKNIGNVPIKVVDTATGKTIGHIRKLDFVTSQYTNTTGIEQYRNVQTLYDEDGNPVPIQESHVKDIMAIREQVIRDFHNGKKTDGQIESKGTGQVILNRGDANASGIRKVKTGYARSVKPEKSLLPDKNLTISILNGNKAWVSPKVEFSKPVAYDKIDMPDGSVVAMLPTPNGTHIYTQLVGQKLIEGDRRTALNSVARAIELYLLSGSQEDGIGDEIKKLQSNTGFDLSSHNGLKRFINQYFTYTRGFEHSALSADISAASVAKPEFLFSIRPPVNGTKASIEAGFSFSGAKEPAYATLKNGKLSDEFKTMLEQGFNTRSRSVVFPDTNFGVRGINDTGTFKDAIYTTTGWRHPEYENYNEYVKSFSKTAAYGRNQLKDGTYVYTANPQMEFSAHPATKDTLIDTKPNETATKVELPEKATTVPSQAHIATQQLDDLMTNFSISAPVYTVKSDEIGTAPEKSVELSPQSLENIYNFTPEAERNGKTIKEVYDNLTQRGHTFLPEGFNPFTRCL